MKGTIRFITRFIFVIFLFSLLFSFAMFQGSFVSWFLFFGFLPIFLYHLGLLFYPMKHWKVKRTFTHHTLQSGDRASITIRIQRTIPFPLYYCVIEEIMPDTLYNRKRKYDKRSLRGKPDKSHNNRLLKRITFPWFRRVIELPYDIEQVPRGEHHLSAIRIRTGDVFGFIRKEYTFPAKDELVVYPKQRTIRLNERVDSLGEGTNASYSFRMKNTNVSTGVREYVPGDKFSSIHWKQTARKNTMMTREFEQERNMDTIIILDGCHDKDVDFLAFEAAVEVTLALLEMIKKQTSNVSLLSIGEEVLTFPFHHGSTQKSLIDQHLIRIQPIGKKPFALQLKNEIKKFKKNKVVILVITHIDKSLQQLLERANNQTKQMVVFLIQSTNRLSAEEHDFVRQLQWEGIKTCVLTEKELVKDPIEVNL